MSKLMSIWDAISPIKDGNSIMIGGFGPKAYPGRLMHTLQKFTEVKDLFFICNAPSKNYLASLEKMLAHRCSGIICTYVRGSYAEQMYLDNKLELIPQGTFAERLRAGGSGIPAFLTSVGLDTEVAKGKDIIEIDGERYLMERALKADVALIRSTVVDTDGNCFMRGATKVFSALMPAAAKYCVVEAEKIVQVGEIDPELVTVPGILVDAIVKGA